MAGTLPRTTSANSAICTRTWKSGSPGTSACCGIGLRRADDGLGETEPRAGHVVGVDLDADPTAAKRLGHLAGHVAAGEGVEYDLARLGHEANEEFRHRRRKAGGVDGQPRRAALAEIVIAGAGVRYFEQVGWDGAAVVLAEMRSDLVLGGPQGG